MRNAIPFTAEYATNIVPKSFVSNAEKKQRTTSVNATSREKQLFSFQDIILQIYINRMVKHCFEG